MTRLTKWSHKWPKQWKQQTGYINNVEESCRIISPLEVFELKAKINKWEKWKATSKERHAKGKAKAYLGIAKRNNKEKLHVVNDWKPKLIKQAKIKWWGWLIIIFNCIALWVAYKMENLYDNWGNIQW